MHTSQLAHHTSERPETPENGHRAFQAAPPTGWPGDFRDLWDCTRGCPGDWRGGWEGHGDLSMTFPVTSRVTHAGDPGSRAEFRRRRPATRQTVSGSPRKGPCELLDLSFSPPGSPGCNLKGAGPCGQLPTHARAFCRFGSKKNFSQQADYLSLAAPKIHM